jgi:hypothetical protein
LSIFIIFETDEQTINKIYQQEKIKEIDGKIIINVNKHIEINEYFNLRQPKIKSAKTCVSLYGLIAREYVKLIALV